MELQMKDFKIGDPQMCFPRTKLRHFVQNLIFFVFSVVSVLRLWFVRRMTTCEVLCGQWCFQLCGTLENLKFPLRSAFKLCYSVLRTPCSLTGGFPTFRRCCHLQFYSRIEFGKLHLGSLVTRGK